MFAPNLIRNIRYSVTLISICCLHGCMYLCVSFFRWLNTLFLSIFTYLFRAVVFAITSLLDCMIYGSWVIVPLNFLKFNFLSSGGDYYGTHPWHWYFTQGFPVMLFTFLPFCVAGVIYSKCWRLSGLIGWVVGMYSVLGHKEFRCILNLTTVVSFLFAS